ncbi:MAG TPA: hypothetical protein VNT51_13435, partial [Miltoncostaeaceae bacterium]|nr:hypothetical protein [Miltoncostaeaceae bacterium]
MTRQPPTLRHGARWPWSPPRRSGLARAAGVALALTSAALALWRLGGDLALPRVDRGSLPLVMSALLALVASGALKA